MATDAERESPNEALLAQAVKEIFTPGIVTFGHGTYTEESARGILEDGLYSDKGILPMAADTVMSPNLDVSDGHAMSEVLERIHHWTYHDRGLPFLILIQLPLPPDKKDEVDANYRRWEQLVKEYYPFVFQRLPQSKTINGIDRQFFYRLPREYIRGYINRDTGEFFANEHYNPTFASQLLQP